MEEKPNWPNWNRETEADNSSALKTKLINAFLVISLASLVVVALLFARQSAENDKTAQEWQALAGNWQRQSRILQDKLLASEKDVRDLERRSIALSTEKASAEDARSAYEKLSLELIGVGKLQQSCSNQMTILAGKISKKDNAWLAQNGDRVLRVCEKAALRFQEIRVPKGDS